VYVRMAGRVPHDSGIDPKMTL
ncbi:MAG: hypothetical protein QOE40_756, partial [Actinomycetota bacterium]|nr:hypothetical protein [Actinomycetota bacterium]